MTNYEFYLKCQEEGISDLKTNADKARIRLIAENNGIIANEEECVKMFKLGIDKFRQQKKSEKELANWADIKEQRKNETEQISEAIKISELFGREKPIYFCQKEINKLQSSIDENEKQINTIKNGTSALINASKVKEQNWALRGGIAEGIAGSAAGVATALETQSKNAQIRAYNDAMTKSAIKNELQLTSKYYENIYYLERQISWQEEKIDYHKKRLIEELPEIDLLEKLNPKIIEQKTTKTGALKLTVQTNAVGIFIYNDVKATIDGSFKALFINENNDVIDEIYFCLPYDGADKTHHLTGYSSKNIGKDKNCKIIFIPVNLWAVETNDNIICTTDKTIFQNKKEIAEYWKKDMPHQKKHINVLKLKIEEIKKTKTSINQEACIQICVGVVSGIIGVLCLICELVGIGLFLTLLSIPFLYFGCSYAVQFKEKSTKEKEKRIKLLKKQINVKEDILNKKIKEIENVLN